MSFHGDGDEEEHMDDSDADAAFDDGANGEEDDASDLWASVDEDELQAGDPFESPEKVQKETMIEVNMNIIDSFDTPEEALKQSMIEFNREKFGMGRLGCAECHEVVAYRLKTL